MRRLPHAALLVALALCACREPARQAPRPFTAADLAAATTLDARLSRVSLLLSELQLAPGSPAARAADVAPRLQDAADQAAAALASVQHPGDRALATRAVDAARRVARAAGELRAGGTPGALAPAADAFARAVMAYREARAGYRLELPPERGELAAFSSARAALEATEARLGAGEAAPAGAPAAALDAARGAAGRLGPDLRGAALRWVDAEARALDALAALPAATPDVGPGLSLRYLAAKTDALDALAELRRVAAAAR